MSNRSVPFAEAQGSWLYRLFFRPTSTTRLAVLRIFCVGLQLFAFAYGLETHFALLAADSFNQPQLIMQALAAVVGEDVLRTEAVIGGLWWLVQVAGVLALLGLRTRLSLLVYAVGTMLLIAHVHSYGSVRHTQGLYALFLLMLAFSPSGDCLSVDAWVRRGRGGGHGDGRHWTQGRATAEARWPLTTIQLLLAIAYFDAGLSKILVGGLHWVNGYTLQNYLLFYGLHDNRPLGVWASQYRWLCVAFSMGTIALECSFWLTLLPRLRRIVPLILLGGIMMHTSIFVLQSAPFFQWMVLYLTWVPWEQLRGTRSAARPAPIAENPPEPPSLSRPA